MAKGRKEANNLGMKRYTPEVTSLADAINLNNKRGINMSGRGRGRLKNAKIKTKVSRTKKRDMLYLVRELVQVLREQPRNLGKGFALDGGSHLTTTSHWANFLVKDVQYFDCDEIYSYVENNLFNMYPSEDVPPHPDAMLPAENVGLYVSNHKTLILGAEFENIPDTEEVLYVCVPTALGLDHRNYYSVYSFMGTYDDGVRLSKGPFPWGNINLSGSNSKFELMDNQLTHLVPSQKDAMKKTLRIVAGLLQTINQPRFVIQSKRDVSLIKRQSLKKATGRFTPDSWNMVTWNVDKPVKVRDYDEGTGIRQALHFRRGHFRKSEEHWENVRWSEIRNRWEKYIHGYEAGHPAFGVKKSYHLPRKGEAE